MSPLVVDAFQIGTNKVLLRLCSYLTAYGFGDIVLLLLLIHHVIELMLGRPGDQRSLVELVLHVVVGIGRTRDTFAMTAGRVEQCYMLVL